MGQFFGKEKINKLEKTSASVLTLPLGSTLRIGGRTYSLTSNLTMDTSTDIDTGAIAINSRYYVYAVAISKVVSLKYSLSSEQPDGIAAYRLLGGFNTAISTDIENIENNVDGEVISEIGKISAFGMGDVLDGYLPCDVRVISRSTYSALFAKIGVNHGEGDGSTTFHLPDLRGRFLRGADEAAGRDPDAGSRIASNTGGATGDSVGSIQGDATRSSDLGISSDGNHNHLLVKNEIGGAGAGFWPGGNHITQQGSTGDSYYRLQGTNNTPDVAFSSSNGSHAHPITGGNTETRVINANVKYGIKY